MTTFDEIRTCRRANRLFWNAQVRFAIGSIRDSRNGDPAHLARLYHWLGSELERRRWFKFLEDSP